MTEDLTELRRELVTALQILCNEGVLDTFGHISVRHPSDPGRFLIPYSAAPNCVTEQDIAELDLSSDPARPTERRLYSERFIHGSIYGARADIGAVIHHHPAALMPYCATGSAPLPISQAGAAMGKTVAFWDSRLEFGDTNLLVSDGEMGDSLARALGPDWIVLMRRHGVTVAGRNLHEAVYRAISACENAAYAATAQSEGGVEPLSDGELDAIQPNIPARSERAWQFWAERLRAAGRAST